jgi:hypothetical protein
VTVRGCFRLKELRIVEKVRGYHVTVRNFESIATESLKAKINSQCKLATLRGANRKKFDTKTYVPQNLDSHDIDYFAVSYFSGEAKAANNTNRNYL